MAFFKKKKEKKKKTRNYQKNLPLNLFDIVATLSCQTLKKGDLPYRGLTSMMNLNNLNMYKYRGREVNHDEKSYIFDFYLIFNIKWYQITQSVYVNM